jgi:cbb3-type cytochrome oxidase maturation protein
MAIWIFILLATLLAATGMLAVLLWSIQSDQFEELEEAGRRLL